MNGKYKIHIFLGSLLRRSWDSIERKREPILDMSTMNAFKWSTKVFISMFPKQSYLEACINPIVMYHMYMLGFVQHLHYLFENTKSLYLPRKNVNYHLAPFLINVFVHRVLPVYFETRPFGHLFKFRVDLFIIDLQFSLSDFKPSWILFVLLFLPLCAQPYQVLLVASFELLYVDDCTSLNTLHYILLLSLGRLKLIQNLVMPLHTLDPWLGFVQTHQLSICRGQSSPLITLRGIVDVVVDILYPWIL